MNKKNWIDISGPGSYSGMFIHKNVESKTVGKISDGSDIRSDMNTIITNTAMDGTPGYRQFRRFLQLHPEVSHITWRKQLYLTFKHDSTFVSSYETDVILMTNNPGLTP
ncbi:hypothetical protein [uncultured Methanospirillum sp.]|uniref:hypothetical protein n=1 Tax=uncultured Methanospirillum sp. TaxID=262503 RepID=UPI0029C9226F|nr:hypothetical protein [uncultured Methanospirillum sp.]